MSATDATPKRRPEVKNADFITELVGLTAFLESQDSLEQSLNTLSAMIAELLDSENCSIMLLKRSADDPPQLHVFAHHGDLPEEAYRQPLSINQGIAGKVVATGKPLLINDIYQTDYRHQSRRQQPIDGGFISTPIRLGEQCIGVINLSKPKYERQFDNNDLRLTDLVALVVGKSIQVFQLQHLLKTNFIQLSLARETQSTLNATLADITRDGGRMAKLLAQSFFREMQGAGFGTEHILTSATELIALLNAKLSKTQD